RTGAPGATRVAPGKHPVAAATRPRASLSVQSAVKASGDSQELPHLEHWCMVVGPTCTAGMSPLHPGQWSTGPPTALGSMTFAPQCGQNCEPTIMDPMHAGHATVARREPQ